MDALITIGGAVKAATDNPNGVEGYLVRFTNENDTDITSLRDYFTKSTDFDLERSTRVTLYYDHCLDKTMGKNKLGEGEVTVDDVGVYIKGTVDCVSPFKSFMTALPDTMQSWAESQLKIREK